MTNTATIDPDDSGGTAARDALRAAIEQVRGEEARLAALTEAQTRARQQGWHAQTVLSEASDKLTKVTREESARIAYEFLNNADGELTNPVSLAQEHVNTAQAELDRLQNVQNALAAEVQHTQGNLRQLRLQLWQAMSEVIVASEEYQALLSAHSETWTRLRSIKIALRTVGAGLHGQLPQRYHDQAERSESLEDRIVGAPVDRQFVDQWADAMSALEQDADAALPPNI